MIDTVTTKPQQAASGWEVLSPGRGMVDVHSSRWRHWYECLGASIALPWGC
jgi:hypothetical protein